MPTGFGAGGTTDSEGTYHRSFVPENGITYITAQPSPPQLTAEFNGLPGFVSTTWSAALESERANLRDAMDNRVTTDETLFGKTAFNITSALNNEIVGGRCSLTFRLNNTAGSYTFYIRGKNPRDATARAHITATVGAEFAPYAWLIAKHESKNGNRFYNQFNATESLAELPNKGNGNDNFGWGIAQIDNGRLGSPTALVYDWHRNVQAMNAKLNEAAATYNRFVGYYRNMYANNPAVHWHEPDNVTTTLVGYVVSAKMWSVLTFYNGAGGCPQRELEGVGRRVPLEFIPSTSSWVLHPNNKDYVRLVLTDRNQTETE